MKITLDVPDNTLRDSIGSAGIANWARLTAGTWNRAKLALTVVEDDGGKRFRLGRRSLARGLVILATKYPHHYSDLIAGTGDMWTGDALVQCAAFGELKYG